MASGSVVLAASLIGGLGCGATLDTVPGETRAGHFVRVSGSRFRLDGRPYRFVGVNYWQAIHLASTGPGGDRERLTAELDALAAHGLRNVRIMASGEGPASEPYRVVPTLQPEPGVYDPKLLDGLDFVLRELAARDMKAVLCLGNFWHWSGGFAQYVRWTSHTPIPYPSDVPGSWERFGIYAASFYKEESAVQMYRDHVEAIVTRRSGLTGRLYRDDPTIMAWELANEPRGMGAVKHFRDWIDDSARLIKELDPNHLVTTGTEGTGPAPGVTGLDLVGDHSSEWIDYATVHLWVENWGWYRPGTSDSIEEALSEGRRYVQAQLQDAARLGKPVVLEEFGMARDERSFDPESSSRHRDRFFDAVLGWALTSESVAFEGANIWAWAGRARPAAAEWRRGDEFTGDPPHEPQGWYSIYDTDLSTLRVLERYARMLMSDGRR